RAMLKLESLTKALEKKPERKDDARRLTEAVSLQQRRDLVIKLAWQGEGDLDLKVIEPSGSFCWALNRQSIGGGVLVGDTLGDTNSETYLAAQAFSGEYSIEVHKVWGPKILDKAQLRIISHQGTKDEHEKLVTVDLNSGRPTTFRLE